MSFADLAVNDVLLTPPTADVNQAAQWDAQWEERVDGVGSASVTVQDRTNSGPEYGRGTIVNDPGAGPASSRTSWGWRDIMRISVDGASLYTGEVVRSSLQLPTGFPWRRWKLSATDFNSILDTRLVGAPDGSVWETIDGGQTHTPIDPFAKGLSRDGDTVKALIAQYVELPRFVGPTTLGTGTFVHNWIPRNVMVDPATGQSRLRWTQTTLRSALDEMRALGGFPIFCWIDPDLEVHWEALSNWAVIASGGLPLLRPRAPFVRNAPSVLVDDSPNGTTSVGFRDLSIEYDAGYMPQQAYISGITDFIYNGGSTIYQGTGWPVRLSGRRDQLAGFRQVNVDAEAVTDKQHNAVASAVQNYARRARIRGSVKVGKPGEAVDGWRCGQILRIFDSRLPPSLYGVGFPIQRVAGKLVSGNEFREYTLEFGDYPIARFSAKYSTSSQRLQTARLPAREHKIYWPTHHLRPSTTYTLTSQMVDRSSKPVRQGGIAVDWSLRVVDGAGVLQSTGSIVAITSTTDAHGRTAATLTTGATTDLHYHVKVRTVAQA